MRAVAAVLCEGQVWRVGVNGVTAIQGFPEASGNCGCLRWLTVTSGDGIVARINPEYAAYILYAENGNGV